MAQKITQKKQSGRQAIVALIEEGAVTTGASGGATALTKGTFYTVIEKKSGSSLPAAEGHQFLATSALTLVEGEQVMALSDPWAQEAFLGFANSKSYDESKNSYDQTDDWDEEADNGVEDLTNRTGSISGVALNDAPEGCPYDLIMSEFQHTVDQNAAQTANQELEPDAPVHLVAYIDNKNAPAAGDKVDIKFFPLRFTSHGESSSYGGVSTCQFGWSGASVTAKGSKATRLKTTIPSAT